jgi:hypothetical protein
MAGNDLLDFNRDLSVADKQPRSIIEAEFSGEPLSTRTKLHGVLLTSTHKLGAKGCERRKRE